MDLEAGPPTCFDQDMSTTLIEVRPAKAADAAAVASTHDEAWRSAYQGIIPGAELEKLINRRGPQWWDSAIRKGSRVSVLVFGDKVALVHGRLTPAQKQAEMERFARADAKVLVATTVIEVGVDVPAASIMIIEHAERFGLAQLHQLRGRVGRGAARSACLLLYKEPLSETAKARLETIKGT
jgi:hypothetical protein